MLKHSPFANLSAQIRDEKVRADAQAVEAKNRRRAAEMRRELDRKAAEALAIERAAVEKRASESAIKRTLILAFLADLEGCKAIGDGVLPAKMREEKRRIKAARQAKRQASREKRAACEAAHARNLAAKKQRFANEAVRDASDLRLKGGWNVREEEGRPKPKNQKHAWTGNGRHRRTIAISEYGVAYSVRKPEYEYDIHLRHRESGSVVRVRRVADSESWWQPNIDVRFHGGCPNTTCTGEYRSRAIRTVDGWERNGMIFPDNEPVEEAYDRTQVLTGPVPQGRPKRSYG